MMRSLQLRGVRRAVRVHGARARRLRSARAVGRRPGSTGRLDAFLDGIRTPRGRTRRSCRAATVARRRCFGVHARQGAVRAGIRAEQSARLGAHPACRHSTSCIDGTLGFVSWQHDLQRWPIVTERRRHGKATTPRSTSSRQPNHRRRTGTVEAAPIAPNAIATARRRLPRCGPTRAARSTMPTSASMARSQARTTSACAPTPLSRARRRARHGLRGLAGGRAGARDKK